jgi:hypothetical protein
MIVEALDLDRMCDAVVQPQCDAEALGGVMPLSLEVVTLESQCISEPVEPLSVFEGVDAHTVTCSLVRPRSEGIGRQKPRRTSEVLPALAS